MAENTNKESVDDRVIATIGALTRCAYQVTAQTSLADDLNVDSLERAEIAIALEDEFDVILPMDAEQDAATVQDIINLVKGAMQ